MNKNVLIIVAAIVVVGAGIGTVLVLNNRDDKPTVNESQTENIQNTENIDQTSENNTTTESIRALLTKGESQECTFSYEESGTSVSGTAYFSNQEQLRLNFKSQGSTESQDGSMIIKDGQQYFWDNNTKQGVKFAFSQEEAESSQQQSQSQGIDPSKDINFTCKAWEVDSAFFTPPTDVKFTDLSAITMPGSTQN